jgi:hypothetical protein
MCNVEPVVVTAGDGRGMPRATGLSCGFDCSRLGRCEIFAFNRDHHRYTRLKTGPFS